MRVCACVVLVCVISARAMAQDPGQSAASVQEFLRKGGENWSAPAKARSILGSVSAGDRFWIWPTEDRVLPLRRGTPGTARQIVIWELLSGRVLARCLTDGPSLPPNQWVIGISGDGRSVGLTRQDSGTVTVCRAPANQHPGP